MATYRIYLVDEAGHIRSAPREFDLPSDRDALTIAEQMAGDQRVEVWNRARFVAAFEPARRTG